MPERCGSLAGQNAAETLNSPATAAGHARRAAAVLAPFVENLKGVIRQDTLPTGARHERLARFVESESRSLGGRLREVQSAADRDAEIAGDSCPELDLILGASQRLLSMLESRVRTATVGSKCRRPQPPPVVLRPEPAVADAYWMACHHSEILGAYNDDSEYARLFISKGRDSFIQDEIGRPGLEMMMDYWLVPRSVLEDGGLSPEQKLMTAKYTLWQNPDWGGRDHYRDEYWAWEPGFTDADCALFTGNQISALGAEYSVTRSPRTLRRLERMVDALVYFDALKGEDRDPLATGPPDGRLQRGPKTKNYFLADDPCVVTVRRGDDGIDIQTNLGRADPTTGRERSNVSRDQYYGVLTGYYVLFRTLSELTDARPEEAALRERVVAHSRLILRYLRGPRVRPGYGLAYNLYSLLEGACANPPNMGFIGAAAIRGLEKITGDHVPANDILHYPLLDLVLDLGVVVQSFGLMDALLEDGRTTLTTLNQYMGALIMSDLPRAHWEFFFPADYLREADSGVRVGWRRIVGAYAYRFGDLGPDEYAGIVAEMLLPENLPAGMESFCSRDKGDWTIVEPQTVLEDFVWPFALLAAAAENRAEIGELLNERHEALAASGEMNFAHTDIAPGI